MDTSIRYYDRCKYKSVQTYYGDKKSENWCVEIIIY